MKTEGVRIIIREFQKGVVMKKSVLLFSFLLIFSSVIYAQEIIENPEKPLSEKAGRVVNLERILQVKDTGAEFFFQYPLNPKIAADNSFFIKDSNQLLRFDQTGRFIQNYFKEGQGPGEMVFIGNYNFFQDGIIIQSYNPPKLMWFNFSGELLKEMTIPRMAGSTYLFNRGDNFYFIKAQFPRISGESRIVDAPQELIMFTDSGEKSVDLAEFPTKQYVVRGKKGGAGAVPINNLITTSFQNRFLFLSHTLEYSIKLYDAEENQVTKIIKRKYNRVRSSKEIEDRKGVPIIDGNVVTPPPQKYANDIEHLFIVNDKLWVLTSTRDEEQRALIDVFDIGGKYIDNFYLLLPKGLTSLGFHLKLIYIYGGFLLAIEKNQDETYSLVKYKIIDEN